MENATTTPLDTAEKDSQTRQSGTIIQIALDQESPTDPDPPTRTEVQAPSFARPTVPTGATTPPSNTNQKEAAAESVPGKQAETTLPYDIEQIPEMFRHDFEWEEPTINFECPKGGPGGFLCCDECGKAYSDVLSQTFQQLERQKSNKVAAEVESISKFMELNHSRLTISVQKAQQKPPPMVLKNT
jgi:hypothetical protein